MASTGPTGLYTAEQRARRDASPWTWVQGVLAPVQFLVFLVSLSWVSYSMVTGEASTWALGSVVVKTAVLYLIMVTGCIWEKVVFGQYLFAPAFFWEDVVSMGVLALHTAYIWVWWTQAWSTRDQLGLALAAYALYVINALQYLRKLRMARQQAATASLLNPPATATPWVTGEATP